MNYKEITYNTYKYNENGEREINEEKTLRFRLESGACVSLEKIVNKSILEYIQEESITMIITMIRYMRMFEDKVITINQAQKIYDELIDDGWTMKKVLNDLVYETLVISGFLEKSEWEEMKTQAEQIAQALKKERMEAVMKVLESK